MAATPLTLPERYELVDRIAVGGMAEVFRAKAVGAHGFEKILAIKRILPELAAVPEFEERFIGEAKLAVKLSHANVVQVLDFGRLAGTLFIAMEFVDGLDLAMLLRRYRERGQLVPLPAAFHMAIEIARGLDFAHQHGVVHRDISPSNILLSRAGEVKIADFGIAQAVGDARAHDQRRIMGKWRYMSPEQTRGQHMTAKSDLFSAAAVLFELFTGEKLFPGDDSDKVIDNIRRMPLPLASEQRTGVPPRLDEVLAGALERDPAARPARAADMLRALIEISYDSSIVASALDVSEAVALVLEPAAPPAASAGGSALDELIRAQLGGLAEAHRNTAVGDVVGGDGDGDGGGGGLGDGEVATGMLVRKGVDKDGVTLWELDSATVAAGPSAIKKTGALAAIDASASSSLPAAEASQVVPVEVAEHRVPRGLVAFLVLATLAAGLASAWVLGRGASEPAPVVAVVSDAGSASHTAELDIESTPAGAAVTVDGDRLPAPTPTTATVEIGEPHVVEVELIGHRPWRDAEVVPRAGERLRIRAVLEVVQARLEVETQPPGATVALDGVELGVTPLVRSDLAPGKGVLTINKDGFKTETVEVVLADGSPQRVERRLRSAIVYGKINLHIVDSWAEVSLDGKALGRAPGSLRLPVGKHTLRLFNPASKKQKLLPVEVFEDHDAYYSVSL